MNSNSIWLIILAVVIPVVILVLSFYILVYFQHPEDRSTSYVSKFVVILGLTLAMATVLMVPFDVANQGEQFGCGIFTNDCGELLGIDWVWMILFLLITVMVFLVIPFTLFFYESFDFENDSTCKACWAASGYQVFATIIGVGILVVCFIFLKDTAPPVQNYVVPTSASSWISCNETSCSGIVLTPDILSQPPVTGSKDFIEFPTPFLVFLPGIIGFVGWFLFSLYAGIGLIALPIELIRAFVHRPRYLPRSVYIKLKLGIQTRTVELLELGEKLREDMKNNQGGSKVSVSNFKRSREERRLFNEFKQKVIELEDEYAILKLCHENWKAYNPFIPFFKLLFGILGATVSLLWILHIILYNLARTPYGPDGIPTLYFLNTMFNAASKEINFTLIGTVLVGVFTFYLLFATMKGNEKFGLRFFLIEIHPMKYNGTYMNSFLVNTSLLLITIPPLIQFVSSALSEYIVMTDLDAIFGQQITFLLFFRVFYENNVFIIIMLSVSFITLLVMTFCTTDAQTKQSKRLSKRIMEFKAKEEEEKKAESGRKNSKKARELAEASKSSRQIDADHSYIHASASSSAATAPEPPVSNAMAQV